MLIRSVFIMILVNAVVSFLHSPLATLSVSRTNVRSLLNERKSSLLSITNSIQMNAQETTIQIPLGDGFKSVECKFRPLFSNSMFFVTDYSVPFDINIEKPAKGGIPAPIVTKAGPGGEQPGDVLRALTCWSQGFSAAGVTSDIAMFAGTCVCMSDYL